MLAFSAVVAIAASAAAFFIVIGVVCVVVWVRVRKERHALRLLGLRNGPYTRSLLGFTGDTVTELSRAEGSVLRAHGQLPYGKPNEWGQLASRESILQSKTSSDSSFPILQKARSIRRSMSISRPRSRRWSRSSFKEPSRMSSMATLSEAATQILPSPPRPSVSKDEVPLSAVEGVLELPAERTPQHTPEIAQEEPGFVLGMRPVSPSWPLPHQGDRAGFPASDSCASKDLFDPGPRVFDESPRRLRGASITSQTAGIVPEQPVPPPPPPTAFPSDRFSYFRNDSVMRLSSMSLDTTNSSILDDGRHRYADTTDLSSSIYPPSGGSYVPYSANDVGVWNGRRSFINTSMPPLHNFPIRSSSTTEGQRKSSVEPPSPRRSNTTTMSRNVSNASSRLSIIGAPQRTDSVSSSTVGRYPSVRSGTSGSGKAPQKSGRISWRNSGSHMGFVPELSQFKQVHSSQEGPSEDDPFTGDSPQLNGAQFTMCSPRQATGSAPPSPMQRSNLSLRGAPHPPSAMKSSNTKSQRRKGHRRQNCVRISIYPPMSFGGSACSPTVEEEPEDLDEMEEVDLRESSVNTPSRPPSVPSSTTSPSPLSKRTSRRNKPPPSTLGVLAEEPQNTAGTGVAKKPNETETPKKESKLSDVFTSQSPTENLRPVESPSGENAPMWSIPELPSPIHELQLPSANGSPRRGVKGPRKQPERNVLTNSTRSPPNPREQLMGLGSPGSLPLITGTQGSDWRKSMDSPSKNGSPDRSHRRSRDSHASVASVKGPSPKYTRKGSVKDRVTIWEDANRSGSPPKPPATHVVGAYLWPEKNSPSSQSSTPRSLPKAPFSSPSHRPRGVPPTPTSGRRGMMTPTGKGLGIGVGVTGTPASLYDGDGFLRE
ncbi:hypothetical protein N7468_007942 [Penicillium chermesinum]|uniref:Uncharacterized protein n=1 Tax=Penicillium chermesinum TaxID=63820 RepID=A0A9W9TJD8_9EURO|nr:uncharacterized protein N7468_007942 [Penicillium chermesinum]KAJ5223400.1 hypothetical protein N7468_007942 [Penicillium chermesinum]